MSLQQRRTVHLQVVVTTLNKDTCSEGCRAYQPQIGAPEGRCMFFAADVHNRKRLESCKNGEQE